MAITQNKDVSLFIPLDYNGERKRKEMVPDSQLTGSPVSLHSPGKF